MCNKMEHSTLKSKCEIGQASQSDLVLEEGVQVSGSVQEGEYLTYSFRTDVFEHTQLQIWVTPSGSDPDVFVSDVDEQPTRGNYEWKSNHLGSRCFPALLQSTEWYVYSRQNALRGERSRDSEEESALEILKGQYPSSSLE
ncbi:hypothetical protein CYMTET_28747 [Cymbomonas tetramitiformis]|uniref:Uncharacterized protein n=1 Tax=Cymbomonas tetramitiformis TaxID=36881 RepID=A0AAE0FMW9_9CHLO|nr:hypothetical protein CYMTET_28747 [Cymbomonas tetramitiformis]